MFDADPLALHARELLRARVGALVAEACAWCVGLSDRPHHHRRHGRVVASGVTLGQRAESGQQLGVEEDERIDLGDATPGTFQDALNALTPTGRLYAELLEEQVLVPFVLETCVAAARTAPAAEPDAWADLLDDLGEEDPEPEDVVRATEWEAPLRTVAEQLVLAALGPVPLVEVEAEGLPLSLVRAAEAETRAAASGPDALELSDDELAGALFLADAAIRSADLPLPVRPDDAHRLLDLLTGEGLEPAEVLGLLPHLPVQVDAADAIAAALADAE